MLALLIAGCAGDDAAPVDGGLPDRDGPPILPPDFVVTEGSSWTGNVGRPCDPTQDGKGCSGDAVCLDVLAAKAGVACDLSTGAGCGGICTLVGCVLEDISTPELEDNCPTGTVCTRIPVASGDKDFCLQRCQPQVDKNPCAGPAGHAGVACHPASIVLNDHTEVCLYPACSLDSDCGNQDPTNPDAVCLAPSGVCLSKGSKTGKVGAPCKQSKDCGPYQYCLLEQKDASGHLFLEGGYCTLIGCKYYDPTDPDTEYWSCPAESKCFAMGSGQFVSFCLAVNCDPDQPVASDSCRDEASDGQYDCILLGQEKVCWVDIKSKSN